MPQAIGIIAAALAAYFVCPAPPRALLTWKMLWFASVTYILIISLVAAAAAWVASVLSARRLSINDQQLASCTAWLAPLAILSIRHSLWAAIPAILFALSIARLFARRPARHPAPVETDAIFHLSEMPTMRQQLFGPLTAACMQAGAVAAYARYPLSATLLFGAAAMMFRWRTSKKRRRSVARAVLAITFALFLTGGALTRYLQPSRYFEQAGDGPRSPLQLAAILFRALFSGGDTDETQGPRRPGPSGPVAIPASNVHPGIILWPDEKQQAVKLVPPPPRTTVSHRPSNIADPMSIPFHGVYWILRAPDKLPPVTSVVRHGNPAEIRFRSNDLATLTMEARQNFANMIDLSCCREIRIEISNGDRHPDTVDMTLILVNTALPGKPSVTLGNRPVKSTLRWKIFDDRPPVNESLDYPVPESPPISQFDEAHVIFRLTGVRSHMSPKIAIERFVLVPR